MKTFEELTEEIKTNKKKASQTLDGVDPRALITRLGHIKRAKENLKELFFEYRKAVMERAVFIIISGKESNSFVEIATSPNFSCFSVRADEVYEQIVSKVNPRYYDKQESSPALFDILMSSFNDVCDDVGIISYPMVTFENKYRRRLNNKEELLQLTKEVFNDKVGVEVVGLYAINKTSIQAVNEEYSGKSIPIILQSADKDFAEQLEKGLSSLSANVFKFNIAKKQKEETVTEKLLTIRENLK